MPDGEQNPQQGPGTPEQQVRFEVTMDKTLRAVAGMFGIDYQSQAGGGGDGKWVFTSLDQLDGVITRWKDIREAIGARRAKIRDAKGLVYAPAEDIMSRLQADALKDSLQAMWQHADNMYSYADAYVQKLANTRSEYANTEDHNVSRMKTRTRTN